MEASVASILAALKREKKWLLRQEGRRPSPSPVSRETRRRQDIVYSCVAILQWSAQDHNPWRYDDRERARRIRDTRGWATTKSVEAVVKLIDLTVSDVCTSKLSMAERPCGCLAIKQVRREISDKQRAALAEGRKIANRPNVYRLAEQRLTNPPTNTRTPGQRRTESPGDQAATG